MSEKMIAEVRVSKIGFSGRPVAQVSVASGIRADQVAAVVRSAVTNEAILRAAGLAACTGCKSGLDINIMDYGQEVIQIEV